MPKEIGGTPRQTWGSVSENGGKYLESCPKRDFLAT